MGNTAARSTFRDILDYMYLYKGCEMEIRHAITRVLDPKYKNPIFLHIHNSRAYFHEKGQPRIGLNVDWEDAKLILRPLSSLTQNEFIEIAAEILRVNKLTFAVINSLWAVCEINEDYDSSYFEFASEHRHIIEPPDYTRDYIIEAEEADFDNVLSYCPKSYSLAYGTSDEIRYWVEPEVSAEWNRLLIKRGFDVFGLIKNKLAIEKEIKIT